MKAIVLTKYGTPDDLELKEVEKPVPKDHEVLIKVHASAVNDWDWGLLRGKPLFMRALGGLLRPKIPIMGCDVAGQIEAVGNNVTTLKAGDDVYGDLSESGFGGFAEYVCARRESVALRGGPHPLDRFSSQLRWNPVHDSSDLGLTGTGA